MEIISRRNLEKIAKINLSQLKYAIMIPSIKVNKRGTLPYLI